MELIRTPEGMRDRLFAECRARREVERGLCALFESRGFSEVATPEAEFYDLFVRSGNPLPQERMLKMTDRSGRILVMRPDSTAPIARVAATRLAVREQPQRLYYNQSVFRSGDAHSGVSGEIAQCGIELIGAAGEEGDFEAVSLAVESLRTCGLKRFYLELGYAGLGAALSGEMCTGRRFAAVFGGEEVLSRAEELLGGNEALTRLRALYSALCAAGYGGHIRFDLGMAHEIDYYTGLVFRGYAAGVGRAVLSGGRYDNLVGRFGPAAPAVGFAVDVDAVQEQGREDAPRLRIALTKGRLADQTVALFEKMGLDCAPIRDPGRRLIHVLPNHPLDAVMAKAPDVVTYVEHGVCDLGVVGADTLREAGGDVIELLDLGFGACRFALAVPEGSDFFGGVQTRRIATKYPNVARAYFEERGMNVSIIQIEGSVELAPLLGLADGIVDIVETGATLRENGLIPIADVTPISARLVVNPASMKLYQAEILDFLQRCEDALGGEA